jgi:hypothetical protein
MAKSKRLAGVEQKKRARPRLVAVVPKEGARPKTDEYRPLVRRDTGQALKAIARHRGITMDALVQDMLRKYVPEHCPDLQILWGK